MKLTHENLKRYTDEYGNVNLSDTNVTELPDELHVKGWLNLSGCSSLTHLPDGLVVGWLDLSGCKKSTQLPPSLKVGVEVYADNGVDVSKVQKLQQGEYAPGKYIYADRILTPVKSCRKVGEYTYYVSKFKCDNVLTDGTYYAHCEDIRSGIRDIEFKKLKDRGMEQYKGLSIDTPYPTDYIINMYRVITGACEQGTRHFVDSLGESKDEYTIREAVNITQGQYNSNVFRDFFI